MKHLTTVSVRLGEETHTKTFNSFDTDRITSYLQSIKDEHDREFDASMAIVYQNRPHLQIDISHDRTPSS